MRTNIVASVFLVMCTCIYAEEEPTSLLEQPVISILVTEYDVTGRLTGMRSVTGRYVGIREELLMEEDPPTKGMLPVTVHRKVAGVESIHHGWVRPKPKKKEPTVTQVAEALRKLRLAGGGDITNTNTNTQNQTVNVNVSVPRSEWRNYNLPEHYYWRGHRYPISRWVRYGRGYRYWCPYRNTWVVY